MACGVYYAFRSKQIHKVHHAILGPGKKYNIQFFNGVTGGVDDEVEDVD